MANRAPVSSPASAGAVASDATSSSTSLCPGCGQGVDPLRAGHVAMLGGRFLYFCRSDCKRAYLHARGGPQEEDIATMRPPEVVDVSRSAPHLDGPASHVRSVEIPPLPPVSGP